MFLARILAAPWLVFFCHFQEPFFNVIRSYPVATYAWLGKKSPAVCSLCSLLGTREFQVDHNSQGGPRSSTITGRNIDVLNQKSAQASAIREQSINLTPYQASGAVVAAAAARLFFNIQWRRTRSVRAGRVYSRTIHKFDRSTSGRGSGAPRGKPRVCP